MWAAVVTRCRLQKFGDARVTYAVFMRRPVISAPRLTIDWLKAMAEERGTEFQIDLRYSEGRWVGAGERYLPDNMPDRRYYRPVPRGLELKIAEALARLRTRGESKG